MSSTPRSRVPAHRPLRAALTTLTALALVVVGLVAVTGPAPAALAASPASSRLWTPTGVQPQARANGAVRAVDPSRSRSYTLDPAVLDTVLPRPAARASTDRAADPVLTIEVPSPQGRLVEFRVREDSVMQPGLQAAHPDLRSYAGTAVDDPTGSIRLDVGALGFHASVRDTGGLGSWYVDPAYVGDQSLYLSYLGSSLPPREQPLESDVARPEGLPDLSGGGDGSARRSSVSATDPDAGAATVRRTYRLALVNDPTYAAYFTGNGCTAGSNACVLSAKQTLVGRVDQIYGTDLDVRLVLIDGTDKLNLSTVAKATGRDGPCGPAVCYSTTQVSECGPATLGRTRTVLGQLVGGSAYDIGHLALGRDSGGLAYVGAVGSRVKAGGCTGVSPPTGDLYAVDYVAHEMGHQFGADHTFEGSSGGACTDATRVAETSVEPGSGSSIMGYAGICGRENLQPHSDPVFSQASQRQVAAYVGRQFSTDPANLQNVDEAQTVSLGGFEDSGDSFRLTYAGQTTARITYPAYAADPSGSVEDALDAILPDGGSADVLPYAAATSYANGFEVDFDSPGLRGRDLPLMSVAVTGGTGSVAETDQGGPLGNQGVAQTTANHNPTVEAPAARTIPTRTPFTLTGSGSDADGDALSYLWEQNDVGGVTGTPLLGQAKRRGPLFRIFGDSADVSDDASEQYDSPGEHLPGTSAARTFPDLAQVLAGNTDAASGTCPTPPSSGAVPEATVDCFSEWLPTSAYVGYGGNASPPRLDFRLTARDGQAAVGGGTAYADTTLTVDPGAGPLLVTGPGAGSQVSAGDTGTVTWTVNHTDDLAPTVRIGLSTDQGETWTQLTGSTANDGSASVTWPAGTSAENARIRVSANDNYFFAVNPGDFTIGDFVSTTISGGPDDGSVATSKSATFTLSSSDPGARFECSLDGAAYAACSSPLTYSDLSSVTHRLLVRAVSDGVADPTPASRTWTVPVGSRGLTKASGSWYRKDDPRSFGGSYVQSPQRGSTLTRRVTDATGIYLIATKYKPAGVVGVYADGRLLRTIYLQSDEFRPRVRIRVADFDTPTTATISIVNLSDTYVRIEGLGVPTD